MDLEHWAGSGLQSQLVSDLHGKLPQAALGVCLNIHLAYFSPVWMAEGSWLWLCDLRCVYVLLLRALEFPGLGLSLMARKL